MESSNSLTGCSITAGPNSPTQGLSSPLKKKIKKIFVA